MNIGGRIVKRLEELGWQRKDLLERVSDLTSQALHNLIKRDSCRSEWDEKIAEALGVSVLWLVYGKESIYDAYHKQLESLYAAENLDNVHYLPKETHEAVREVMQLMNDTDELGKGMILARARDIAKERASKTSKLTLST